MPTRRSSARAIWRRRNSTGAGRPTAGVGLARTERRPHRRRERRARAQFQLDAPAATRSRPTGNAVSLEDEMIKVAANQMDYQAATTLYTPQPRADQNRDRQALSADAKGEEHVMDFLKSIAIAASGLRAQAGRMRIISENIANADSTAPTPGAEPYRRKIPTFQRRDGPRARRAASSRSAACGPIQSEFRLKYEPGHPAADANGNVKYPNVNSLVEMTDMREAQRSYEANINVIGATRRMIQRTIEILKA